MRPNFLFKPPALMSLLALTALSLFGCRHSPAVTTDPKEQAARFFAAAKAKDWQALYSLSEAASAAFPSAGAYAAKMNEAMQQSWIVILYDGMFVKPDIQIGSPVIEGNTATLSITRTSQMAGQPMTHTTDLKMKNIEGVWKVAKDNGYGSMVVGSLDVSFSGKMSDGKVQIIRAPSQDVPLPTESGIAPPTFGGAPVNPPAAVSPQPTEEPPASAEYPQGQSEGASEPGNPGTGEAPPGNPPQETGNTSPTTPESEAPQQNPPPSQDGSESR